MNEPQTINLGGASVGLYRRSPDLDGSRAMAVGNVKFENAEAGVALLKQVIEIARNEAFDAILGPLNGDTWHAYRMVTESDGSAPFLMEPVSGPHDLAAFEQVGFAPVSRYVSAAAKLEDTLGEIPAEVPGVTISAWDGRDTEKLIRHLFDMSSGSFARNRFFTPITFESFLELYRPVVPVIDPRHVLFAHDENGDLRGFLFGIPDLHAGNVMPSAILKTYASSMRGVGHLLADTYHRRALDLGFKRVIHALIHEDNTSRQRSEMHNARVFRRYALMGLRVQT